MRKLFILFFGGILISQTFAQSRGLKIADENSVASGATKLVVVGVSKYQNVQSLSYAHTDAQAFYNYMVSKDGAGIDPANAKILLNEKATSANIFLTLDWLLETTQENENVIFYFAGHGDLETKTIMQNGFLLANDAPQNVYVAGGTVPVRFLQDYITTLIQKNKAKVILITDACRSGKLAGGMEGVANTATALQSQWENSVKILSSQPGELSYEGNQWNGGGGVFTYYLVKGLMGFADRNRDYKITLNEMNVYLNDNIPRETNFAQNPSILGNPATILAKIDSVKFLEMKSKENGLKIDNKQLAQRGNEEDYKKSLDTATYSLYKKFRYCIENGYLVKSHEKYGNAKKIFEALKSDPKAKTIIGAMKASLIAALQNRTQIGINMFINGDRPPDSLGFLIFGELEYALNLLDSGNLMYNSVKSRWLSLQAFQNTNPALLGKVNEAIRLEPDFALPYFMRGLIYRNNNINIDSAHLDFDMALFYAPKWVNVINNKGHAYLMQNKPDRALQSFLKCIKIKPDFISAYYSLARFYDKAGKKDSSFYYLHKADSIGTSLKNPDYMQEIGDMYFKGKMIDSAIYYYEKSIHFGTRFQWPYCQLNKLYAAKNDKVNEEYYLKKCLETSIQRNKDMIRYHPDESSEKPNLYYNISCYNSLLGNKNEAIKYLELSLKEGWSDFEHIQKDTDLDNIRNTNEFKELMKKYYPKK